MARGKSGFDLPVKGSKYSRLGCDNDKLYLAAGTWNVCADRSEPCFTEEESAITTIYHVFTGNVLCGKCRADVCGDFRNLLCRNFILHFLCQKKGFDLVAVDCLDCF